MQSYLCFSVKFFLAIFNFLILFLIWPFLPITVKKGCSNSVFGSLAHFFFVRSFMVRVEYLNVEKLNHSANRIYAPNHQSFFDVPLVGKIFPCNSYFIAKDSLKFIPYFGFMYWISGNYLIKRTNAEKAKNTMAGVGEKIKKDRSSIFIMPQGTRSPDNKVTKLKRGFINLAKATQTDIQPIVISTYKLKDILTQFVYKKTIYVKVCDPIDHTLPDEEILLRVKNLMNDTIEELDKLASIDEKSQN